MSWAESGKKMGSGGFGKGCLVQEAITSGCVGVLAWRGIGAVLPNSS